MVDCFRFYAESHNEDEPLSRRSSQRTAAMFIRDALDARNGTTLEFITHECRTLLSQNGYEDFVLAAVLLELLRWLEDEKAMRYGLPRYSGRTLTIAICSSEIQDEDADYEGGKSAVCTQEMRNALTRSSYRE
jgi:hypothetical protein